jgi:hypothetical protein
MLVVEEGREVTKEVTGVRHMTGGRRVIDERRKGDRI